MDDPVPRYRWRKTWPDKEDDFVALDAGLTIGRIHGHHMGDWFWCLYHVDHVCNGGSLSPMAGYEARPRLAAQKVEDCYEAVITGRWPGMTARDIALQRTLNVGHPAMYVEN